MNLARLQLAEHVTTLHHLTPELGLTIDDVLKPGYYANEAKKMRPGDLIQVHSPMGDWWALLIVRAVGRVEASVSVILYKPLDDVADLSVQESPYEIKWRGPSVKFSVVRKEDKAVVKENFQTKEQADLWLKNHMKAMAA